MIQAHDEIVDDENVVTEFAGTSSMPIVDNDFFLDWCCNMYQLDLAID